MGDDGSETVPFVWDQQIPIGIIHAHSPISQKAKEVDTFIFDFNGFDDWLGAVCTKFFFAFFCLTYCINAQHCLTCIIIHIKTNQSWGTELMNEI